MVNTIGTIALIKKESLLWLHINFTFGLWSWNSKCQYVWFANPHWMGGVSKPIRRSTLSLSLRATSHTRLWARDHYTSNTLIGRKDGAWSKLASHYAWETNEIRECKMDVKSTWIPTWHQMDQVSWSLENHLLTVGLTQNLNITHNRWFILLYYVWGPAWIEFQWDQIWLRARSHMTLHYTWGSMSRLHDLGGCVGTAFGHFLVGSHNFMVTALDSCVKWPLKCPQYIAPHTLNSIICRRFHR